MWPLEAGRQLEISPSTVIPVNSDSIRCLSWALSSLTERGARFGPRTSSTSSSSNGRPSHSELIHLLRGEIDALDGSGATSLFVRFHDDAVEPRVFSGGLETLRQSCQESLNDGGALDPDHRVVRTRHPDVGDVRRAL